MLDTPKEALNPPSQEPLIRGDGEVMGRPVFHCDALRRETGEAHAGSSRNRNSGLKGLNI